MASLFKQEYYSGVTVQPEDVFHVGPHDANTETARARQERLEGIASRFLDNQTPHIISALLRGPFGKESGWSNPYLGADDKRPQRTRQLAPTVQRRIDDITVTGNLATEQAQIMHHGPSPEKVRDLKLHLKPHPFMEDTDRIERWKQDVPSLKKDGFYRQYLREINSTARKGHEIICKRRKTAADSSDDATPILNGCSTPSSRHALVEGFKTPTKRSAREDAKDELAANSSTPSTSFSNIAQAGSSPTMRVSPRRMIYNTKLAADSEDELVRAEAANRKAAATLSSPVSDVGKPSQTTKGTTVLPPPKFNITQNQLHTKNHVSPTMEEQGQRRKRKLDDFESTDDAQHGSTQPMTPESGIAERRPSVQDISDACSSSSCSSDTDPDRSYTDERNTQTLVKTIANQLDHLERTDFEPNLWTRDQAQDDDGQSCEDEDEDQSEEEDTMSMISETRMRELSAEVRDYDTDEESSSSSTHSDTSGLEDSIAVSVEAISPSKESITSVQMDVDTEIQNDEDPEATESEVERLDAPTGGKVKPGTVAHIEQPQSPWSKSQDTQSLGRVLEELVPNVRQVSACLADEPCTPTKQSPWSKSQDTQALTMPRSALLESSDNLGPTEGANIFRAPSPKASEAMRPSTPTGNRLAATSEFTVRPFSEFMTPSPQRHSRKTRFDNIEASSGSKHVLVSAMKKPGSTSTTRQKRHVSFALPNKTNTSFKDAANADVEASGSEGSRTRELSPPPPPHLSEQGIRDKEFTSHFRAMVSRASDVPHNVHNLVFNSPTPSRTTMSFFGSQDDKRSPSFFDTEMPLAELDTALDTDLLTDMVFQNIENECFGGFDIDAELTNM